MNNMPVLLACIFFVSLSITPAQAYLDPGAASFVLQGLVGGVAAVVTVVSLYYGKIKKFISSVFSSKKD